MFNRNVNTVRVDCYNYHTSLRVIKSQLLRQLYYIKTYYETRKRCKRQHYPTEGNTPYRVTLEGIILGQAT
jgi:hypothetical protein